MGWEEEEKKSEKNRMATTAAPFATLFFFTGHYPTAYLIGCGQAQASLEWATWTSKTSLLLTIFYSFELILMWANCCSNQFPWFYQFSFYCSHWFGELPSSLVRLPLNRIFEALKVPTSDHAWHNIVAESSTTTGCRDHKGGHSLPPTRCETKWECSVGYLESS